MPTKIIVGQVWQPDRHKSTVTIMQVAGDQVTYRWGDSSVSCTRLKGEFLREWRLVRDAVPGVRPEWLYSEASRLQAAAHAAIDEYNKYIESKPETVFVRIFK